MKYSDSVDTKLAQLSQQISEVLDTKTTLRELGNLPPGTVTNLLRLDRSLSRAYGPVSNDGF